MNHLLDGVMRIPDLSEGVEGLVAPTTDSKSLCMASLFMLVFTECFKSCAVMIFVLSDEPKIFL